MDNFVAELIKSANHFNTELEYHSIMESSFGGIDYDLIEQPKDKKNNDFSISVSFMGGTSNIQFKMIRPLIFKNKSIIDNALKQIEKELKNGEIDKIAELIIDDMEDMSIDDLKKTVLVKPDHIEIEIENKDELNVSVVWSNISSKKLCYVIEYKVQDTLITTDHTVRRKYN